MQNEEKTLLPEVRALLHDLLSQAEQTGRRQVVRVRLNKPEYRWYSSGEEPGLRQEANQQLQHLTNQGFLSLHWQKYEEGNLLAAIDLLSKDAENGTTLYQLLRRRPLNEMKQSTQELLEAQETIEGWFSHFIAWALIQLASDKSIAPLSLSDQQTNRDLLLALSTLAKLQVPLLERTLSMKLFNKSKRLEELRQNILSVLRNHDPYAAAYGDDDDWALLQSHYLYRSSEYLYLEGSLDLEVERKRQSAQNQKVLLHLDDELSSIGLSEAMVRHADIRACSAEAILTIENWTSFHELLFLRPPSLLVIYTGGFASPSMISFLKRIRSSHPKLLFYHWGDIDVGGLRILAHLRRTIGMVHPLGMDTKTLIHYSIMTQVLTKQDQKNLELLLANTYVSDCLPLINYMHEANKKLEQEAINPSYILQRIEIMKQE